MPKIKDTINPALKNIVKGIDELPEDAYKYFKSITPIDTGNARRKTKISKNNILANYDYATELDKGHSKQAPEGMTVPTQRYIDKEFDKIFRRNK